MTYIYSNKEKSKIEQIISNFHTNFQNRFNYLNVGQKSMKTYFDIQKINDNIWNELERFHIEKTLQ